MLTLPPLSIYVHIPWCERKCPYCDFNSHQPKTDLPEQDYVDALLQDLNSQLDRVAGRKIHSVFFGGGTPSLFSAHSIAQIIDAIDHTIGFEPNAEITLEANPGSSERAKFAEFYQAGVNRLSIGIQSFQDEKLSVLGRIHSTAEALQSIDALHAAGFTRFNLDLMHGLPAQSFDDALFDLRTAINTGAQHVSWYQLTIEQNTEFYRYPPVLPEEEALADIQDAGFELLREHGFAQYEVSAFATAPKHRAKHNMNYWQFGDYLAIGAGAHGKVSAYANGQLQIERFSNTRLPKDYLARVGHYVASRDKVKTQDALFEGLMNGLRLNEGLAVDSLLARTGASLQHLQQRVQPFIDKGLLHMGETIDTNIGTTDFGRQYLNTILEGLLE